MGNSSWVMVNNGDHDRRKKGRPIMTRLALLTPLTAIVTVFALAQPGKEPPAPNLANVLDGKPAAWKVGPFAGATADHTVADVDGRQAVVVGPNGLDLTTVAPITGDAEVRAVLRLRRRRTSVRAPIFPRASRKRATRRRTRYCRRLSFMGAPTPPMRRVCIGPWPRCPARRTRPPASFSSRSCRATGSPGRSWRAVASSRTSRRNRR